MKSQEIEKYKIMKLKYVEDTGTREAAATAAIQAYTSWLSSSLFS
jgi:hypothetical protein